MADSSSTSFSATDGRKFAFPVGIAFLFLGGVLLWRDHGTAYRVAAGLGAGLILAGVVIPRHLGPLHRGWMGMAAAISRVTTPIVLGVVYFLLITPMGLIMRRVGKRPIRHEPRDGSFWQSTEGRPEGDLRRQF